MPNDKPILMQPDMVRATLREIEKPGTGKTQTRRIIKPQPRIDAQGNWWHPDGNYGQSLPPAHYRNFANNKCPYGQKGDRLWVREAWTRYFEDSLPLYRANYKQLELPSGVKWKPSIHMPRWASRLTLDINDIRVERVQDISEADAKAEGCVSTYNCDDFDISGCHAAEHFANLWQSINGAESWDANPWVWVIDFTPHLCNIDAMPQQEAA